jgi:hypothetical protein
VFHPYTIISKQLGLTHLVEGKGVFGRAEPAQTPPLSLRTA